MGERTMNTWLGLLKWSLNYHDGTKAVGDTAGSGNGSGPKPMSDADRAWLMAALKAHTVDEVERMKLIRSILSLPDTAVAMRKALADSGLLTELHTGPGGVGGAAPDAKSAAASDDSALIALGVGEKLKALEELDERVETIDNALDFFKIGGLQPLLQTLRNLRHPELVWRAAQVFSTVLQNNPKCQAQAVAANVLDALLPLLDLFRAGDKGAAAGGAPAAAAASADVKAATPAEAEWNSAAAALTAEQRERVVTKALLATSSLVRDNPQGLAQFLSTGSAVDRLLRVAGASGAASGLRRKAVSLLRHILSVAVEAQTNAAQSAAIAQAGPAAAAAAADGVKVTVGQRGGPQKMGGVTITGGPANGAAAAAAAAAAAPAAAAAAAAAAPAKTDVKSATAAVNALKQSIVAAGGVGVLAGLIDFAADVDLRSSAVELLNELLSGAPDAPGAAAALSALKAAPTHALAAKAIASRAEHYHKGVATAQLNVADPAAADAVDECRGAYAELQLLWRLVQFGAFPDAAKAVGSEYRRFAVVVAKADAEERKQQAAALKARGVGSLYSTSQAAPTRETHSNTDTPVTDTPLLK